MIIMLFDIYGKDMADMNTELMLSGTSKSPPVVKMIVIGHGLTVSILCFPIEALEESESSNSAGRGAYSSGYTRDINYNEELREMREKEQLETLQRIERDLRYK